MGIEREFGTGKGAEAPTSDPIESRRIVCDERSGATNTVVK
jgi:hypothetical protein